MSARKEAINKISRPRLPTVYARERLFGVLDQSRRYPVVWVSAPAGAGKTTLVSSYLESRHLACLWYQIDSRDADPATFFYYMSLAVRQASPQKAKTPSPAYTGIQAGHRHIRPALLRGGLPTPAKAHDLGDGQLPAHSFQSHPARPHPSGALHHSRRHDGDPDQPGGPAVTLQPHAGQPENGACRLESDSIDPGRDCRNRPIADSRIAFRYNHPPFASDGRRMGRRVDADTGPSRP